MVQEDEIIHQKPMYQKTLTLHLLSENVYTLYKYIGTYKTHT